MNAAMISLASRYPKIQNSSRAYIKTRTLCRRMASRWTAIRSLYELRRARLFPALSSFQFIPHLPNVNPLWARVLPRSAREFKRASPNRYIWLCFSHREKKRARARARGCKRHTYRERERERERDHICKNPARNVVHL